MLKFYQGDFVSARNFAIQVFNRSLFSPYRYRFATSLCMIDTAMGNFSSAIRFGEQAISLHRSDHKKYLLQRCVICQLRRQRPEI